MKQLKYSIKDLENFTQIKAHTIRIWEQRYGLLSPKRTETNIRYYSEDDLKKILNINLLYNSGLKISKIASLSDSEIIDRAKERIQDSNEEELSLIDSIVLAITNYESETIIEILNDYDADLDVLYHDLALPLFEKIGKLWQVNTINVVHEHFFSNIFKQFILSKIHALPINKKADKSALIFLHDSEEHEFSLLMYYYVLERAGIKCYYFGQKVPIDEIVTVHEQLKPTMVVSTFTAKLSDKKFQKIEDILLGMTKTSEVLVSGAQLVNRKIKKNKKLKQIKSILELKKMIN